MLKNIPLKVEILRNNLGNTEGNCHIKAWEFILFIVGCHIKQIIELFIATFIGSASIGSFIKIYPLNTDLFWSLICKVLIGFTTICYFLFRYKNKTIIRNVAIYWLFSVGNGLASNYARFGIIPIGVAGLITITIYFLLFLYAFAWDGNNWDCLMMLFYEGLEIDKTTGRIYKTPWTKFSPKRIEQLLMWSVIVVVSSIAICTCIVYFVHFIIKLIDRASVTTVKEVQETKNQTRINELARENLIAMLMSALIIAPVTEELVFRKCLMQLGGKYEILSIVASAFIFGLIHLNRESIIKMIPYSIYGCSFALMMWATRNMWPGVLCHLLFNLLATINTLVFR